MNKGRVKNCSNCKKDKHINNFQKNYAKYEECKRKKVFFVTISTKIVIKSAEKIF